MKSGTSKKENNNLADEMVEKFGKSWDSLICQVDLVILLTDGIVAHSFTCKRFPDSILIICRIAININIPVKYWW